MTELYLPREVYPRGYSLVVFPSVLGRILPEDNIVHLTPLASSSAQRTKEVTLTIKPN